MTITAITIENFKGIREPVRVDIKPITLLFGPNSAGKSTIIQAFHYAREILERENVNPDRTIAGGKTIDLGGFKALVHNNDLMLTIRLKIDLNLREVDLSDYLNFYSDEDSEESIVEWEDIANECLRGVNSAYVECSVMWDNEDEKPVLESYKIGINSKDFAMIERQTTSPLPCKLTIFSHEILRGFLSDNSYDEEDEILDDYLYAKSPQPEDDDTKVKEYERELSYRYEEEKDRIEREQEVYSDVAPDFIADIRMFLRQDSALPTWNTKLDFVNPFWEVDIETENDLYRNLLSTLILGPGKILLEELEKAKYLGPIRELPSRNHIPALSPDSSRWAEGLAAWDILYSANDEFIENLNHWLVKDDGLNIHYLVERKTFKELDTNSELWVSLIHGLTLDEDIDIRNALISLPEKTRLYLEDESGIELAPQDIGVGISQVLPVVVIALNSREGIVAIEQPELHVHPAIQVALGDLFISRIKEKDLFFLLETHSEHLMLRFLRRIRETEESELPPGKNPLKPEQLAVYFIEQSQEGINAIPIRINKDGEFIDKWPRGFFNERMEELF